MRTPADSGASRRSPEAGTRGAGFGPLSRNVSRREFLRLAGVSAAALGLTGCSGLFSDEPAAEEEQVQLVYQDWRTDWFPPMAQQELSQFHAYHPGIRVFYTPDPEDFLEQMRADMQSGTAADVFQGCCAHFPGWAQDGYLLDLRSFVERDRAELDIEDWDPVQYTALFLDDGLQFGLPKYHGALALYYNRDLFDEAGVDYPDGSWDHDDYLAAMRALTRDADGDGAPEIFGSMIDVGWDRIQVHVNAFGGHFVDPGDPLQCGMAAPPALDALEWPRARIWDDRAMATARDVNGLSTRDAFIAGRVAMVEDGSWALKDILEKAPFRVGAAPFPAGPSRRVTMASTDGFAIFVGTQYPEEAWELMKFLVSRPYALAMAEANFLQPARLSLIEEWKRIVRHAFPAQGGFLELDAFAEGQREGYAVTVEVFPVDMVEAVRIADAAWQQILTLGTAPVSIMNRVSAEIERSQGKVTPPGDSEMRLRELR